MHNAEHEAEMFFVDKVRESTKSASGWRAAAWWLERRRAETFGIQKQDTLTKEKIKEFLEKVMNLAVSCTNDENTKENIVDDTKNIIDSMDL
jgi:hypothetical protein